MDVGVLLFAAPRQAAPLAQLVEGLGFHGVLFPDSQNLLPEVWGQLALAAAATSRIVLGPGVTPRAARPRASRASPHARRGRGADAPLTATGGFSRASRRCMDAAGAMDADTDDPAGVSPVAVRDDLRRTHAFLLDHIARPGTWWTGAERVALATASRAAARCALCRDRRASVSPAVPGRHDGPAELPDHVVDAVHRIRSDPARLSRAWFDGVIARGLDVARYVELVGVTTATAGLDYFARALGTAPLPLPAPRPGDPTRHRPAGARPGAAWVPMLAVEDATGPDADVYGGADFVPNIVRALSLVPDEVRALRCATESHYVPVAQIGDPTVRRTLDRPQMELVAARVSALNECFY